MIRYFNFNIPVIDNDKKLYVVKESDNISLCINERGKEEFKLLIPIDQEHITEIKRDLVLIWTNRISKRYVYIDTYIGDICLKAIEDSNRNKICSIKLIHYIYVPSSGRKTIEIEVNLNREQSRLLYKYMDLFEDKSEFIEYNEVNINDETYYLGESVTITTYSKKVYTGIIKKIKKDIIEVRDVVSHNKDVYVSIEDIRIIKLVNKRKP